MALIMAAFPMLWTLTRGNTGPNQDDVTWAYARLLWVVGGCCGLLWVVVGCCGVVWCGVVWL